MPQQPAARTLVRLLRLQLQLEHRGRRASELAAEHGVSVRCIYRNLDILEEAGIPLYVDEDHRWRVLAAKGGA
jgi:predicted DNA-binding transcriptional regulator YafY